MIGVLALQGNYEMHSKILSNIGAKNIFVKTIDDLSKCKGLIIPGGESTVISKMMNRYGLFKPIRKFAENNSVFGTCAGLILMTNYSSDNIESLNILNVDILRNGWGSQVHSFTENVEVNLGQVKNFFKATFIRAPRIKKIDSSINILANINNIINEAKKLNVSSAHFNFIKNPNEWNAKEPIMIRQNYHLATTFHPEMHGDSLIHKYFLQIVNENK